MDERVNRGNAEGSPGLIRKAAALEAQEVTEAELKLINKFALKPLAASDVFTFAAVLCDNELDRQFEQFSLKALHDLKKLFVGKTVIKDHDASADNQLARIYATELVEHDKFLASGEPYTQLKAHCYMLRTDSNKDLIAEIEAGIKKEGSVGFRASSSVCSICGTDNVRSYCRHWPGKTYDKEGGPALCTFKLDGVKDAYEFSLVAVPAQRSAGVSKSYTGQTVYEKDMALEPEPNEKDHEQETVLALRVRLAAAKQRKEEE